MEIKSEFQRQKLLPILILMTSLVVFLGDGWLAAAAGDCEDIMTKKKKMHQQAAGAIKLEYNENGKRR